MLCSLLLFALIASAQGRAVNISNTWVLPEEGFPVFYRYFRDRISWYEADAVCQFHHANLVTVDTTAQYDAVRAYLKELDISSAVWVGLIRSNPDGDFTWTDYRGLSGDGYWSSAPDARSAPLCAAADPAADYRWEARACGGPTVASFICELPVPQWALGNEGCMVRALPALTVLYLPESAAVQLTADCGMAGVKRLQCTGNVKHEELLRDLSCTEDEESPQPTSMTSTVTTGVTTDGDPETSEATNEEIATTEHEDDLLNIITSTPDLFKHISSTQNQVMTNRPVQSQNNKIASIKNINLDIALHNNLQSNDIPRLAMHDNFYSNEQLQKQEDEKNMQHKLLHDELARLGNIENIFSQPTDHFVPPLVMAKAKVNEDINAISFEEKLAQQHSEYVMSKHIYENNATQNVVNDKDQKSTSTGKSILSTTEVSQTSTLNELKDKKEMSKHVLPKKYDHKSNDIKSKPQPIKFMKNIKSTAISQTEGTSAVMETTTFRNVVYFDPTNEDSLLDLTVIIKEPETNNSSATNNSNNSLDVSYINKTNNKQLRMEADSTIQSVPETYELSSESNDFHNITLNDEIIKITFSHDEMHSPHNLTVLEVTTKMPIFKDSTETDLRITSSTHTSTSTEKADDVSTSARTLIKDEVTMTSNNHMNNIPNITNTEYNYETTKLNVHSTAIMSKTSSENSHIEITTEQHTTETKHMVDDTNNSTSTTPQLAVKEITDELPELEHLDDFDRNITDTSQYIDDFQSPLLSGANEPLHKPNRSRRPQQPANRIKKFNPFRILG